MVNRKERNQGMNWISQKKRLAIYLRDGLACAYCGATIEDGIKLTLDHLKPHSKGGDNKESNLVTCCSKCNSSRGNRSVRSFCKSVATYIRNDWSCIEKRVRNCSKRSLSKSLTDASNLIEKRGSCSSVINSMI